MAKKILFAVLGNPIAHSRSPEIHKLFAEEFGDSIDYQKIEVPLGEFDTALDNLIDDEYLGVNVTIPFKVDAFKSATKCTSRARQARAANTLKFEAGKILADNTDGSGFVRDVQQRLGFDIANKSILILGAGGAVRGILPSLLEADPRKITISNRSLARAQELQDEFGVQCILYDETGAEEYDLIVNATPTSLQNKAPLIEESTFNNCEVAYDLVYSSKPTPFMQMAERVGTKIVSDGLGMLVEQAADSYEFWLGRRPQTASVYEALRKQILASE